MPCYTPMTAYRCADRSISFKVPVDCIEKLTIPCGQCVGCRLERSRQWAIRCMHEAKLYKNNCFITLTYAPFTWIDTRRSSDFTLRKPDFQKFMKRFRKRFHGVEPVAKADGSTDFPIRYYMCGEYGEQNMRPHFHACIFNFDFLDKKPLSKTAAKSKLFRSKSLEELWPFGYSSIGEVNFESAAYVARYVMKKVTGKSSDSHYQFIDPETGEVIQRQPEYNDMSRRPGIGKGFFDKYSTDIYPHDYVIVNGRRMRPPKYYDAQFKNLTAVMSDIDSGELISPDYDALKFNRYDRGKISIDDNTPDRLQAKLRYTQETLKVFKRNL